MLSIFPSLLSFDMLAPLLLRLTLAAVFVCWVYALYRAPVASAHYKALGLLEAVVALLLVIGLWTQLAAIIACIDLAIRLIGRIQNKAFLTDGVNYYFLLLVMSISLLFLGAGYVAFDLPL